MLDDSLTDLATIETPVYIQGGHSGDLNTDVVESVFQDANGNITGYVYGLDKFDKIINPRQSEDSTHLENASLCVGRLVVEYSDGVQKKYWAGSAFKVGRDIAVSAYHVVKEKHDDHPGLQLSKVYFYGGVDARYHHHFCIQHFDRDNDICLLKPLKRHSFSRNDFLEYKLVSGQKTGWKEQNDFIFLKLDDSQTEEKKEAFRRRPYTTPRVSPPGKYECYVIGYPGVVAEKKFLDDYQDHLRGTVEKYMKSILGPGKREREFFLKISAMFFGFEKKIISLGAVSLDGSWLAHTSPTLRGTSGGPLICAKDSSKALVFDAIHVGGSLEMKNNFAISTSAPQFAHDFREAIQDDACVGDALVNEYLAHFNSSAST